jgi:hypothetical protein
MNTSKQVIIFLLFAVLDFALAVSIGNSFSCDCRLRKAGLVVLLWEVASWDRSFWGRLAGSNVYCLSTDPADSCPKAEPWEKESHLIYPYKQVTEAKSKTQPTHDCMWLYWLFHSPSAMWPSCFNSLSFIFLLCHPLPISSSEHQPVCFFSGLPFLATVHTYNPSFQGGWGRRIKNLRPAWTP